MIHKDTLLRQFNPIMKAFFVDFSFKLFFWYFISEVYKKTYFYNSKYNYGKN